MSQHIHHHSNQTHYVHYNPTPQVPPQQQQQQQHQVITHVAPKDTQRQAVMHQQQQQQQQYTTQGTAAGGAQASGTPLVAKGDWTKDLVQLAKTAELKKHALTLQLHTAHILSAHATLEQKSKAIQDLREQKNKLESERTRLLNCLREVNEDRDRVDLMESSLEKECKDTRAKIAQLTETDYAVAKADVDRLREELGQPALPSLQSTLDEKTSQYLNERRLNGNGNEPQTRATVSTSRNTTGATGATDATASSSTNKRGAPSSTAQETHVAKRPRGRPKGSKNRNKTSGDD
ncbi:hypothetical protein M413DRAFT_14995 [Hebeloma cylindrosporum]|uniref:Uncharacterized protein n=1 Tax=Hebeloma cylindrosporum TaxID=76867 RepID=A0A0C2YFP4_HEBCY|nr:hypothetical protein M413DRAFT_14995 [Hebeloma cylindrosporum h7]